MPPPPPINNDPRYNYTQRNSQVEKSPPRDPRPRKQNTPTCDPQPQVREPYDPRPHARQLSLEKSPPRDLRPRKKQNSSTCDPHTQERESYDPSPHVRQPSLEELEKQLLEQLEEYHQQRANLRNVQYESSDYPLLSNEDWKMLNQVTHDNTSMASKFDKY